MNLKQIAKIFNENKISVSELEFLIKINGFTPIDSTNVGESKNEVLIYKQDCITLKVEKK
jgi:hypothetical protein